MHFSVGLFAMQHNEAIWQGCPFFGSYSSHAAVQKFDQFRLIASPIQVQLRET